MFSSVGVLALLIVLAMVWLVFRLSQSNDRDGLTRRERAELDALRSLVDDLKETAWDHRELDSPLATIIIDKIRRHERRNRELGP
jgi:hypothetical protein